MPTRITARVFIGAALVAVVLATGCAAPGTSSDPKFASAAAGGQSAQHAECLVCKYNADLACVDVTIDKSTPVAQYDGKTYHFCSDECRNEFLKHPQKYAR